MKWVSCSKCGHIEIMYYNNGIPVNMRGKTCLRCGKGTYILTVFENTEYQHKLDISTKKIALKMRVRVKDGGT